MISSFRFMTRLIAAVVIGAGILSLVFLSPLLLRELTHIKRINWQQLGNIGQTYGAPAAILSGVALIAVAFTLFVQARQAETERIRIVRERHMELIKITLDNPEVYAPGVGTSVDSSLDADKLRMRLMFTMWMNWGRMGYQMNVLTGRALRADFFPNIFRSDLGRTWWSGVRKLWLNDPVPNRRARSFAEMADEEYRRAIATGPPSILANKAQRETLHSSRRRGLVTMVSGIIIGVIITLRVAGDRKSRN